MAVIADLLPQLRRAIRPLSQPPGAPGWNHEEMRDLLGESSRRAAAVLVGVVERGSGPRVVLTQRTDDMPHHAGQISFPGGGQKACDADVIATALRETHEEIGVPPRLIRPIGYLDCFETISGFCVTPVVAELDPSCRPVADPREVADVFEAPLAFFLDPANLGWRRMLYRERRRNIPQFLLPGHTVWGATAAILQNLATRMREVVQA